MFQIMDKVFSLLFEEYRRIKWEYYYVGKDTTLTEKFPVVPNRDNDIAIVAFNKAIFNYLSGNQKHKHESFVLNYAYRGSFEIIIDDEERYLQQGDIYIMQPRVSHTVKYIEKNDDSIMISVFIKKELMARSMVNIMPKDGGMLDFVLRPFFDKKSMRFIIVNCDNDQLIKHHINMMLNEYVMNDICGKQLVQCAFATILGLIGRKRYFQLDKTVNSNDAVRGIIEYINQNFKDITLKSLAQIFKYNPNYLSTLIRKEAGKTFSELVRDAKLQNACFLLLNTDYSINDIAEQSGYTYVGNFYKTFRVRFGVSPSAFRNGEIAKSI